MAVPLLIATSVLLLYLASPGPGFAFLAWLALAPLLIATSTSRPLKAFVWGLAGGTLYHLLLIYWVTISMQTYGGLPPLQSWPALLLLAFYMALYFAFFCYLVSKTHKMLALVWSAPLFWVSLDFLRGFVLTGFPWMDLGYSQFYHLPLIQIADLFGHHGVSFLIVLVNGLLAQLWLDRDWWQQHKRQLGAVVVILSCCLTYGFVRLGQLDKAMETSPALAVAVVQANIDQAKKWQKEYKKPSLDKHLRLSRQARAANKAELVVWPETALAFYPSHDPLMAYVKEQTVTSAPFHLLTGAPNVQRGPTAYAYYNSALLLSPGGKMDIYHKQHLVPFGEYIPLRSILPIPKPIVESMGDFSAGTSSRPLDMGRAKIGALICIEAIYPRLARRETAQGATLLANITNDAWFGASSAPIQHLAMAIFRSVENRRSMARAANTGISALILPTGMIMVRSELFQAAHLTGELPLLSSATLFTRFGFAFPHLCLLMSLLLLAQTLKKDTRK